jgi:hypothetical protein
VPNFPESGVRLVAETSDYTSAMQEALALADQFDALGDMSVTLTADVDTSSIESSIPDDATITINPEIGDSSDLLNLEALDDAPIDAKIKTTEDPGSEQIGGKSILTTLHELGINPTEIVMNIAGTLVDGLKTLTSFSVQPLLDLDTAVARVNAQTAGAIPNAHELITGIFYDDLGDSIDQVANLVIQAEQLGAPIDEATRAALTFTHTFTDQDPTQVLNTMNNLVSTGLVPNFTTASDLLVTGFQEGDNRANDLLTTLNNNASALSDMGLNGSQSLSLIKSGLDGGAKSAQDVVDMLIKIKANVITAAGNAGSDVSTLLTNLGIPNPVTSGEGWSADFLTKVRDAIAAAPVDDATKQQMVSTLLGGKLGAKDYSEFMNLDAANPAFDTLTGKAATAASTMDDSLSGAIADFVKAAQGAATDFLSSDQIDLPGKITALKSGLQDALNTLATGGTLGDALTVALKPIGFDDEFQGLESALGNFVIGILQAVADIQDALGKSKEAQGTRATIAGMAQNQLTFDLKIGNPDAIAGDIATAVSRGVTPDQIAKSASTAVTELVKSGSTDAAQQLVDSLKGGTFNVAASDSASSLALKAMGFSDNFQIPISPTMSPEDQQKFIADQEAAFKANGVSIDVTVAPKLDQDQINDLQDKIDTALHPPTPTITAFGGSYGGTQPSTFSGFGGATLANNQPGTSGAFDPEPIKGAVTAFDTLNTTVQGTTITAFDSLNTSTQTLTGTTETHAQTMDKVNQATAAASISSTDLAGAALDANLAQSDMAQSLASIVAQEQALQAQYDAGTISLDAFNQKFAELLAIAGNSGGTGGTGTSTVVDTTEGPHAAGTSNATGTFIAGEAGPELVTTNRSLAVLNNKSTEAIMAALNGFIPGASKGGGGNKTVILNQTNYVPSQAVGDSLGYNTAQQLRGV